MRESTREYVTKWGGRWIRRYGLGATGTYDVMREGSREEREGTGEKDRSQTNSTGKTVSIVRDHITGTGTGRREFRKQDDRESLGWEFGGRVQRGVG